MAIGMNLSPAAYATKRASDKLFGFPIRSKLFPGEDQFFKDRPEVTGMAAEDDSIILNPYSSLSKREQGFVAQNEALRLKMRKDDFDPKIQLTDEQQGFFKGTEYASDPRSMRQTILARIYSGDPSAKATGEQKKVLQQYLSNNR